MTKYIDDILAILGAVLIIIGVSMIQFEAGVIVAGLFCLAAALVYGRFMAVSTETAPDDKR